MRDTDPLPRSPASATRLPAMLARILAGLFAPRRRPDTDLSRVSVHRLGKRYDRLQTAYRKAGDMDEKSRISQQQIVLTTELRRRRWKANET